MNVIVYIRYVFRRDDLIKLNMVQKRSEYGSEFKTSSLVKNIPVYKEHVTYRSLRRERECAHTPIAWDGDVAIESSDSEEKLTDEVEKLPISELVISEEEEEDNDAESDNEEEDDDIAKEKREAKEKDIIERKNINTSAYDVEIVKQNQSLLQSAKAKLNKYASKTNTNTVRPRQTKDVQEKKVCELLYICYI